MHFKYFFGDHDPDTAVKLYHQYLGNYGLHPFWYLLQITFNIFFSY